MYGETYGMTFWWVWAWASHNAVWVNAAAHLFMFSGILWMVFHNPDQPWYYKNPMWFAGLSSLLCFISIGFQFAFGGDFPFSYKNIGLIGETVFNCCWAFFFVSYLVQQKHG
jgi:hypothetical protein